MNNAFSGGVDALFSGENLNEYDLVVNLDEIEIRKQIREDFEDEDNSLAELGKSLRVKQLQAIGIRLNVDGAEKPYILVWGERRVRGAKLEGLTQLRARVVDMTDEEAEDAQFHENVHRKNFEQLEEAKKLQRDLDSGTTVEALLEKHQKSNAWLSKRLSLLSLTPQSKRLISENVSADIEVINTVKTIEKASPEKAKELVDDLVATKGEKQNTREKVNAVKAEVKPPKPKADDKPKGSTATPRDTKHQEPSEPIVTNPEIQSANEESEAEKEQRIIKDALGKAYVNVFEMGANANMIVQTWDKKTKELATDHLRLHYDHGVKAKDAARASIQGFRNGVFSEDGYLAFAWIAFLHGADTNQKFSLVNIIGSVKP